jgi:hypothetical protein
VALKHRNDRTVCVELWSETIAKTKVPVLQIDFTLSPVAVDSWTPEKSFELIPSPIDQNS